MIVEISETLFLRCLSTIKDYQRENQHREFIVFHTEQTISGLLEARKNAKEKGE